MELDGLAFDEFRLERLDAQPVQGRRAVEKHRMLANDFLEDVPDFRPLLLHHPLCRLDGGRHAVEFQLGVDERLEEFERHLLRQAAFMELELGADHDHRSPGIVAALAEEVLAETPLLALQHVRQRLQRALARAGDHPTAAPVVEQRVHRFLEHPLFVAHDDVGRAQLQQAPQPVVAVDDAAVEIVEVGRREAAAVERHQRAQFGRDHRHRFEDHPLRAVLRVDERFDEFESLDEFFPLGFRIRLREVLAQLRAFFLKVDRREHVANRLGADPGAERVVAIFVDAGDVLILGKQLVRRQRRQSRFDDHVVLEVEDALDFLEGHIEERCDARRQRFQEPDMRDRRGEFDMPHAFAAHIGLDDLHAALLAHDAAVLHALVFTAQALVVLDGTEYPGAEQAVALRLEGPVVDGLRLPHLAERPGTDLFRAGDRDADFVEPRRARRRGEQVHQFVHIASPAPARRSRDRRRSMRKFTRLRRGPRRGRGTGAP